MILASLGFFLQVVRQQLAHDVFHRGAHFARHQLVLGLAAELGLGHLHAEHAAQAFAHVVAGDFDLGLLGQLVFFDVLVDDAGHRGAQAGQVGAAVTLGMLLVKHSTCSVYALFHCMATSTPMCVPGCRRSSRRALACGVERGGVQNGLALVDELDKAAHATGAPRSRLPCRCARPEADAHAVVQNESSRRRLARIS